MAANIKAEAQAAVRALHQHGSREDIDAFQAWYLRYLSRLPLTAGGDPMGTAERRNAERAQKYRQALRARRSA